jgi:hypothetical protein
LNEPLRALLEFAHSVAEVWFERWSDPNMLINDPNSPLEAPSRAALQRAATGSVAAEDLEMTRRLLGAV